MTLEKLDNDELFYLQTIFHYFQEEGKWPTHKYIERFFIRIMPDSDIEDIVQGLPKGLTNPVNLNDPNSKAYLSIPAVYLCDNSTQILEGLIHLIQHCITIYFNRDDPRLNSEELRDHYAWKELAIRKLGLLLQKIPDIWTTFGYNDTDGSWSAVISKGIRRFRDIQTIEQYLENIGFKQESVRATLTNSEELVNHRDDSNQNISPKTEKLIKLKSQSNLKNHIHSWIKGNQKIDSPLGEIKIGRQIGEGGNALVFESPFLGGTAIKFLSESVSFPPSTRYARFLDEYRNLIKLIPTAAIVPLYHYALQEMDGKKIPYVVMERCVKTLYETYNSSKLSSPSEFQLLLDRLLKIIDVVHASGIVHRDIKPQNILLRRNHTWVLGDFGIAWFDKENT
jgi:hypothetical protein